MRKVFGRLSILFLLWMGVSSSVLADSHLIILSGQSNMVRLDVDRFFTPIVGAAFPNDHIAIARYARSGQPIRRWDEQWQDSRGRKLNADGRFYNRLLDDARDELEKHKANTVTFVWMQGEADANTGFGEVYRQSLERIISNLKRDLGVAEIAVVIGRISDFGLGTPGDAQWKMVRQAQQDVPEAQQYGAWVNTDDLNDFYSKNPQHKGQVTNLLHYTKEGYETLGRRFAEQTIALIKQMQAQQGGSGIK